MKNPDKLSQKQILKLSKIELIKIAEDLSKGKYEMESEQRKQILQMIADELNASSESPP